MDELLCGDIWEGLMGEDEENSEEDSETERVPPMSASLSVMVVVQLMFFFTFGTF